MVAKNKLIAFGWYGGKFSHLNWLLPLLPKSNHYCEVFGGSMAVLLNRDPCPIETYNDIDSQLVNFFRVLREKQPELERVLSLTPYSREEYNNSLHHGPDDSDIEKARKFFIKCRMTFGGMAQSASKGRFSTIVKDSRNGMSCVVSRWFNSIPGLEQISKRILRVQVENLSGLELLKKYDSKDTFFYLDPPYVHESRKDKKVYLAEMTNQDHENLAMALKKINGKFAISGYKSNLYDKLYKDYLRIDANEKIAYSSKEKRQELLWCNYDPYQESNQRHFDW